MPFSVFSLLFSKKLPSIGKRYFAHQYDFPSNRFFFKQGFIVCKKRVCRMGTVLTFCKLFCNVNDDENKKKSYAQNFSMWPWPRDLTQTSFFLRRWLHITFGFFLESLKTQINFRKKNFYQQITFISRWTWKIWFSRQNLDCNLTQ